MHPYVSLALGDFRRVRSGLINGGDGHQEVQRVDMGAHPNRIADRQAQLGGELPLNCNTGRLGCNRIGSCGQEDQRQFRQMPDNRGHDFLAVPSFAAAVATAGKVVAPGLDPASIPDEELP